MIFKKDKEQQHKTYVEKDGLRKSVGSDLFVFKFKIPLLPGNLVRSIILSQVAVNFLTEVFIYELSKLLGIQALANSFPKGSSCLTLLIIMPVCLPVITSEVTC